VNRPPSLLTLVVGCLGALSLSVALLVVQALPIARGGNEPRTWGADDAEVQELEGLFTASERLEGEITRERGKLQSKYDGAIAYAKGKRQLPVTLTITYDRPTRKWIEKLEGVAPVSSAK